MIPLDCLSQDQLRDFSLGLLAEPAHQRATDHVAGCTACQAALAECDSAGDTSGFASKHEDPHPGPLPQAGDGE